MQVRPYLSFEGRCEEAVEFYRTAVGAEVIMLMRYKDAPDQSMISAGVSDKVMHVALRIGESVVMASDGRNTGHMAFSGVTLSITTQDDAQTEQIFIALGDGGEVRMPLTTTFFASRFGMLADRFGVSWMVMTGREPGATQ